MNSTRLPGKVLMKSCGETMLGHLTKRLKRVKSLDCIVLATTFNKSDNILEEFANEFNIECFRWSEDNVLNRVLNAAETHNADVIVEITADCPLIDPLLVDKIIEGFENESAYCASKHGLEGLMKSLAIEGSENGIQVFTVTPGMFMKTPMSEQNYDDVYKKKWVDPIELTPAFLKLASGSFNNLSGSHVNAWNLSREEV